jgi:hypothetical protein
VPGQDELDDRIGLPIMNDKGELTENLYGIPWVQQEELALLVPPVLFGTAHGWSRLQIHFSIGQAF